jgi:mannose-6-phosphate isomerase-like protein (cupin superfamily)
MPNSKPPALLVRHTDEALTESSTCGTRRRLISRDDAAANVAAWAHEVVMDTSAAHYHQRATELYYVLEGEGVITLDGEDHPLRPGSMVHIPPRVVHATRGHMRVLVVGIPDIDDDDVYLVE